MATQTINMAANNGSSADAWTRTGGSTKQGVVQDASDATYISATGAGQDQYFTTAAHTVTGSISSVDLNVRTSGTLGSTTIYGLLTLSGNTTVTTGIPCEISNNQNYTRTGLARPGGGSWTPADITNVLPGLRCVSLESSALAANAFEFSLTVTFTASPTVQASATYTGQVSTTGRGIGSDNVSPLGWTRGNGASVIVFVKAVGSGGPSPVDGTTYTASAIFGAGSQIGSTGWYAVYAGTGTSVIVRGLAASTAYMIVPIELNGSAGSESYNTSIAGDNDLLVTTVAAGTIINTPGWPNIAPVAGSGLGGFLS